MPDATLPADARNGTVYWITGMPGSGKTVIASALTMLLRSQGRTAILIDGDRVREILGGAHGYSPDERRYLASVYGRLCADLASQGPDVVCATVSLFHSQREWNRESIPGYVEVYVEAPEDDRHGRRKLYADAKGVERPDHAAYELPRSPDVTITNDGRLTPAEIASAVILRAGPRPSM